MKENDTALAAYPRVALEPISEGSLLGEYATCRWYGVARWKHGPGELDVSSISVPGVTREDALGHLALELVKQCRSGPNVRGK